MSEIRWLVLVLVAAACGGSPASVDAGDPDAGGQPDAGGPDAGGVLDAGDNTPRVGSVSLSVNDSTDPDGGPVQRTFVSAYFIEGPSPFPLGPVKTSGECRLSEWSRTTPDGGPRMASAGALHVEGGRTPVTLFPDNSGEYGVAIPDSPFIVGGERLTIAADGNEVPGFTTTLFAPPTVQFTAPVPQPPSSTISVAADAGLAFAWYPASVSVVVSTDILPSGGHLYSLGCSFKSPSGTGTVPAELLAAFPVGAQFQIRAMAAVSEKVSVPPWDIFVGISRTARGPNGGEPSWLVRHQ
jgi:hypothetical protein